MKDNFQFLGTPLQDYFLLIIHIVVFVLTDSSVSSTLFHRAGTQLLGETSFHR